MFLSRVARRYADCRSYLVITVILIVAAFIVLAGTVVIIAFVVLIIVTVDGVARVVGFIIKFWEIVGFGVIAVYSKWAFENCFTLNNWGRNGVNLWDARAGIGRRCGDRLGWIEVRSLAVITASGSLPTAAAISVGGSLGSEVVMGLEASSIKVPSSSSAPLSMLVGSGALARRGFHFSRSP